MVDRKAAAHDRYHTAMVEVKRRLRTILRILGAQNRRRPATEDDIEFMWLQVRKIVELVAFAGVSPDAPRYARLRGDDSDGTGYAHRWRVYEILACLANMTDHFLPIPISGVRVMEDGRWQFDAGKEQEVLERFFQIYERACEHLQVPSPFGRAALSVRLHPLDESRALLVEDVDFLTGLLWTHVKLGLDLDGGESPEAGGPITAWLVRFGRPNREDVHVVLAERIGRPGGGGSGGLQERASGS